MKCNLILASEKKKNSLINTKVFIFQHYLTCVMQLYLISEAQYNVVVLCIYNTAEYYWILTLSCESIGLYGHNDTLYIYNFRMSI